MKVFEKKGKENTQATVDLVLREAKARGIQHIVVASNTGETAMKFAGHGLNVVCVTHAIGFAEPGKDDVPAGMREKMQEAGVKVLTTTHALSGVERGISGKASGMYPAEIIANSLRMLGQGTKVCVEVSIMALDAGLIPYGEKVIAVGGSARGADTATVITPAHANAVFDTFINEILCKPGA